MMATGEPEETTRFGRTNGRTKNNCRCLKKKG